jgi:hypothetical protein
MADLCKYRCQHQGKSPERVEWNLPSNRSISMKISPSAAAIKTRHLALDPSANLPREIAPSLKSCNA